METPTVFISYSRKDEQEKEALLTQLGVLQAEGLVEVWSDDRLEAGGDWKAEIDSALDRAAVAILLVTANFLTSRFILEQEVPRLLQRHRNQGVTVFPVIAKHCAWRKVRWLSAMTIRPRNGTPVWDEGERHADRDLARIAEEVADILERRARTVPSTPLPPAPAPLGDTLSITIEAPDRQLYETETEPDVLVARLQTDFLAEWKPPEDSPRVRYTLRASPEGAPLNVTQTLREAGITNGTRLYLAAETLRPESAVGLVVEGPGGSRYAATVRLDTPVRRLAEAFLTETAGRGGDAAVELLPGNDTPRRLRSESTLYDERVGDRGLLRILPV